MFSLRKNRLRNRIQTKTLKKTALKKMLLLMMTRTAIQLKEQAKLNQRKKSQKIKIRRTKKLSLTKQMQRKQKAMKSCRSKVRISIQ